MKRILTIGLLLCAAGLRLMAQDTLSRSRIYGSEVLRLGAEQADAVSPAAFLFTELPAFTEASLGWEGRKEDRALVGQEGDGLSQGTFRVRTLVRPDASSAVQGGVSYSNGRKSGVVWNATSDYGLLYPYVLADSLSGDLSREQYSFYGRYARRSGRLHWAAGASFRALHEYRQADPRPRDITSDLTLSGSAGYGLDGYALDLALSYRRYHQSQDVSFYNPKGANTSLFHMTGLGRHFERLAGTSNYTDVSYRGHGAGAALQLLPQGTSPWQARLAAEWLDMVRYLPSLNQTPYTEMQTWSLDAGLTFRRQAADWRYAVSLEGRYEARRGDEIVLDGGQAGYFQGLGQFRMYAADRIEAGLKAAAERRIAAGTLLLQPSVSFLSFDSDYIYPHRSLAFMGVRGLVAAGWEGAPAGGWFFRALAEGGYQGGFEGRFSVPEANTMPRLRTFLGAQYAGFTDKAAVAGARLRAERGVSSGMHVFLEASWRQLFYTGGIGSCFWNIMAGINF